MMKILIPLLFFFPMYIFAQQETNWGFMNGTIYLKQGDSITGLIEKQVSYGQMLAYKLSEHGAIEEIPITKVEYFRADKKKFECLPIYGSQLLMEQLDTGKLSLYFYNEYQYGEAKYDRKTGLKTKHADIKVHYVVKQKDVVQEIREASFKIVLKQLFSDCQRMAGKVWRGDYVFDDMPEIIKDYNHCKGQYCDHSGTSILE